jgi:hypothetical protein
MAFWKVYVKALKTSFSCLMRKSIPISEKMMIPNQTLSHGRKEFLCSKTGMIRLRHANALELKTRSLYKHLHV